MPTNTIKDEESVCTVFCVKLIKQLSKSKCDLWPVLRGKQKIWPNKSFLGIFRLEIIFTVLHKTVMV